METFGMYLLKSAVWLIGFGLIYLIFLRNERYFLLNRIFLFSGLFASAFFPLLNWHYTIIIPIATSSVEFHPPIQALSVVEPFFSVQRLMQILYMSGVSYLLYRITWQTASMLGVIKKAGVLPFKSVKLIRTTEYPVSFSFFSFVFVNPSINETETNEVVNHESEHIRQKHWIDLILFEALCTLQWFNPMIWFYGRFIRQNHEYLADERALQRSVNPAVYRAALLNQMLGGPVIVLAHSFNYSLNTKRFNMMKKKIYSPIRKFKLLLVLPLIAFVFYAFATPEYVYTETASNSDASTKLQIAVQSTYSQNDTVRNSPIIPNKREKNKSVTVVVEAKNNQSDQNLEKKAKKEVITINDKGKQPLYMIDGVVKKNQNMNDVIPDNIQSINVWKGDKATKKYGDRGKDGVIEITMKPGMSSGINYKAKSINVIGYGQKNELKTDSSETQKQEIRIRGVGEKPLLVIDGVISENQNISAISPDNIKSISVLKDKSANILYGDKGKNGVILITMKKGEKTGEVKDASGRTFVVVPSKDVEKEKISIEDNSFKGQIGVQKPLIIKDGEILVNQNMKDIPPDDISSIQVWKGENATKKYGYLGINGVIEINTKTGRTYATGHSNIEDKSSTGSSDNSLIMVKSERNGVNGTNNHPLIVKDGVIAKDQNIKAYRPDSIESVSIFRGKSATDKYGQNGKDGVIEITTKK